MAIATNFEQVTTNSPDGAQMGQATGDKIGFYGSTPVIQPTSANQAVVTATQVAVTDSLDGATFTGTALSTSSTPTVDELEAIAGMLGLAVNAAGTDIAALIVLTNQMRSELVTIGLMKGS